MNGYTLIPPAEDSHGWRITCPQEDGVCAVRKTCPDCPFNDGLWVATTLESILVEAEV